MVDTPTTRNRFRKQEVGTNNNVWGTYLNEVFDCVDQVVDGVESINLGGATSYTLTTSDYTTSDQAKNRVLVCSNVNAAGSDLVLPAVEHVYGIVNNGSADITPSPSGGTGPDIPAGRMTWIYCDGTNAYSLASTTLPVAFSPVNANDPTTKDYVDTAIANASIPAAVGTVLVSGGDTTAGYLGQKVDVSGALTKTITNPGADEAVELSVAAGGYADGGEFDTGTTIAAGSSYMFTSACVICLPSAPSDGAKSQLALFDRDAAYTLNPNGKKINNSTSNLEIPGGQTLEITYNDTLGDWE